MVMRVFTKKYLYSFISLLWIGVIFSFSLQNAEVSSATSKKVGQVIIESSLPVVSKKFDAMSTSELRQFYRILREYAHFIEFFILGVLIYLTLREYAMVHKVGKGIAMCLMVAVLDETLQVFVEGRARELSDMMLDAYGSILGVAIIYVITNINIRIGSEKRRRE